MAHSANLRREAQAARTLATSKLEEAHQVLVDAAHGPHVQDVKRILATEAAACAAEAAAQRRALNDASTGAAAVLGSMFLEEGSVSTDEEDGASIDYEMVDRPFESN